MSETILVTGGAGFIGSNFIRLLAARRPGGRIVNLDALTYAGNLANLEDIEGVDQTFVHGDIASRDDVHKAFRAAGGGASVVHLAAESHVDRSIQAGLPFIRTNVLGTQVLLDGARDHEAARFVHVSTDEVYGSLAPGVFANERSRLAPTNPYSASKAASDHLVLAAVNTHGLDAVITRCSNNYGPYQFPEKLIPLAIGNAGEDLPLPLYGDGLHERDWIHVEDHCEALLAVLAGGRTGSIYNIAGHSHRSNLEVLRFILRELGKPESLVEHVADRPGHDRRYAPDAGRIEAELGFRPRRSFEPAMRDTIRWYREHGPWLEQIRSGAYRDYYETQYGKRTRA